jgi:hypothetical protein
LIPEAKKGKNVWKQGILSTNYRIRTILEKWDFRKYKYHFSFSKPFDLNSIQYLGEYFP